MILSGSVVVVKDHRAKLTPAAGEAGGNSAPTNSSQRRTAGEPQVPATALKGIESESVGPPQRGGGYVGIEYPKGRSIAANRNQDR